MTAPCLYSLGHVNFDADLLTVKSWLENDARITPLNGGHFLDGIHGPIHYRQYLPSPENNKNATIVAVHGAAHNSGFFHDFGVYAANAGYTVYALDLPGHGDSYHHLNYTYPMIAAEVEHFIKMLVSKEGYKNLCFLGASLGGQLRMVLGDRIPAAATVLDDIGPLIDAEVHSRVIHKFETMKKHGLNDMMHTAQKRYKDYGLNDSEGTREFIYASVELCPAVGEEKFYQYKLDRNFGSLYRSVADDKNYADQKPAFSPGIKGSDLTRHFNQIAEPVLILRGANSLFFDPVQLQTICNHSPVNISKVIEVANVMHPVALNHQPLNKEIITFFNQALTL